MNKTYRDLINAGIAGLLVFAGAFADGDLTKTEIITLLGASLVTFLINFKTSFNQVKGVWEFV